MLDYITNRFVCLNYIFKDPRGTTFGSGRDDGASEEVSPSHQEELVMTGFVFIQAKQF